MHYALIKSGTVENVILASPEFIDAIRGQWDYIEPLDAKQVTVVGIGWRFEGAAFLPPDIPEAQPEPPQPAPVWQWYIDLGPFYSRFGAARMAVLTCEDVGVKAVIADLNIRKWVDLKLADVAESLRYVASKVPALTVDIQTKILNTPVSEEENLALRKVYFS